MELLLRDGDYVSDGQGGFVTVEGSQEVLQWVLFQLTVKRGSFPLMPEIGSDLYLLRREKPSVWGKLAEQYVVSALKGERELEVTGVEVTEADAGAISLKVYLDWYGESLVGEVLV